MEWNGTIYVWIRNQPTDRKIFQSGLWLTTDNNYD